jgi:hypothetical protein
MNLLIQNCHLTHNLAYENTLTVKMLFVDGMLWGKMCWVLVTVITKYLKSTTFSRKFSQPGTECLPYASQVKAS